MVRNVYKIVSVKTRLESTAVNTSRVKNKYKLLSDNCHKMHSIMVSKWKLTKSSKAKNVNM